MKVTLLDTKTGETHEVSGIAPTQLVNGSRRDDQGRADYFLLDEAFPSGVQTRFIVVAASPESFDPEHDYTLADLNPGYPEELLAEHGILPLTAGPEGMDIRQSIEKAKVSEEATQAMADAFVENLQAPAPADTPAEESVEVVLLHEMYNPALLGVVVNGDRKVAAYSIELMLATVQTEEVTGRQMATRHVQTVIEAATEALGHRAPVFIDDYEFVQRQKDGGPKIVTPG